MNSTQPVDWSGSDLVALANIYIDDTRAFSQLLNEQSYSVHGQEIATTLTVSLYFSTTKESYSYADIHLVDSNGVTLSSQHIGKDDRINYGSTEEATFQLDPSVRISDLKGYSIVIRHEVSQQKSEATAYELEFGMTVSVLTDRHDKVILSTFTALIDEVEIQALQQKVFSLYQSEG